MSAAPAFPSRGQRLRYAFGGRLPQHRAWVRHDLTSYGWRWRVLLRVLLQVVPVSVVLALLPGPAYLHVVLPVFLLLSSAFVGGAYAEPLRDRRLHQHGLEPPPAARPFGKGDLG